MSKVFIIRTVRLQSVGMISIHAGTAEPGGLGGGFSPPIILEQSFFQLKNYCFTAVLLLLEDLRLELERLCFL